MATTQPSSGGPERAAPEHRVETSPPRPALDVGEVAPDFALPDADGHVVKSASFRGHPLVLYFYPRAGTPGCSTQARDFRDAYGRLRGAGYGLVGVSPDEVAELRAFRDAEGLPFPLLSDPGHAVCEAYGAWGHTRSSGRSGLGVVRTTVVVDRRGEVALVRSDVAAEGHVAELLADLDVAPERG